MMKAALAPESVPTAAPPASRSVVRRVGGLLLRLLAIGLLIILVGVGGLTTYGWLRHNQQVILPQPRGAYAVGRATFDWRDESRPEHFSSDPAAKRELMVWIWYPANKGIKGDPVEYLPEAWRRAIERNNGWLAAFLTQNLDRVRSHALANVPLASAQPSYPVLVMQPGLGRIPADYTAIGEELASHGYIVVASTPTYSSNTVVFADGRVVNGSAAANVADDATPAEAKAVLNQLIAIWAADNRFVLDQLAALDRASAGQPFSGSLDMNRIGLFGHSFGGASAAETCSIDMRCVAGADLDGYLYGDVVQRGLNQPFLFVWSEANPDDPSWQEAERDLASLLERMSNHAYQVTIHDALHFNFTDLPLMYSPVLSLLRVVGPIDSQRALSITTDYLEAFFDHTLQGVESPLLSGPSTAYPEVEFRSR